MENLAARTKLWSLSTSKRKSSEKIVPILVTALLFLAWTTLTGCGGSSDEDSAPTFEGTLNNVEVSEGLQTLALETDDQGLVGLSLNAAGSINKLGISGTSPDQIIRFTAVNGSDGTDYLSPGGQVITGADLFLSGTNQVVAPSRVSDPGIQGRSPLEAVIDPNVGGAGVPVSVNILGRSDGNLGGGSLPVNLFLVGGFSQQSENRQALEQALVLFREILQAGASVNADTQIFEIGGPAVLPDAFAGSVFYLNASASRRSPALNIFVGADVDTSSLGIDGVLGLASSIPGPFTPSARSAVVVSLLEGAGLDGSFSAGDIALLGETLAHEAGHYLGLFHPVEIDENSEIFDEDPLGDTPTCGSLDSCLDNREIFANLMFPTPIVGPGGFRVSQRNLSGEQAGVINRNVLVD